MSNEPRVRIISHAGEADDCRLTKLEQRVNEQDELIAQLREQNTEILKLVVNGQEALLAHLCEQNAEVLELLHGMTAVAAKEHETALFRRHAVEDRVRELELTQ